MKKTVPPAPPRSAARVCALTAFALLFALGQALTARAQWEPSGNNIRNTNTGAVGIGLGANESPTADYKFDVRGLGIFGFTRKLSLNADFGGNGEWPAGAAVTSIGNNSMFMAASPDLGSAGAKTGMAYFNGGGWFSAAEVANVAGGGAARSNLLLMRGGGNVGIRTSAPRTALQIGADADGGTNAADRLNIYAGTDTFNVLRISNGWATPMSLSLGVSQDGGFSDIQSWKSLVGFDFGLVLQRQGGNVVVGGAPRAGVSHKLDVQGGAVNASGGLCINDVCRTSWSEVGGSQWANAASGINYSAGSVGIGVAPSAAAKLDVGGVIRSSAASGFSIGTDLGKQRIERSNSTFLFLTEGDAAAPVGVGGLAITSSFAAVTPPTSGLYVQGNVGVGTATPGAKLDVGAGAAARGGYTDVLVGAGSNNAQIEFYGPTRSTAIAYDEGAGGMIFYTNGPTWGPALFMGNDGRVSVGTDTPPPGFKLHVQGDLNVSGNIAAKFQDVAEWVPSVQKLSSGTVVTLDPARSNHVLASSSAYDTAVAGVVSAQPGIILGEGGEGRVKVATTGRVRVRVDASKGAIRIGDLLVTSDVEGVAMRSEPITVGGRRIHAPGTIIGKALEPLEKGTGEILALLSMQ